MNKYLLILCLALFSWPANAQTVVAPCTTTSTGCTRVSSSNPLPTTGGGAGGSTVVTQPTAANLNMTEANSAAILSAVQGAIPAGTAYIGHTSLDPCSYAVKTTYPVLITGTTTVKIVGEVSAQQVYICSVALIASAATVMSIADGTKNSTECDTAAHAIFGQTTATHGMSLAANGGFTVGGGAGTVGSTATAAHDVCIFQSGSGDISGNIVVVQQ